MTSMLCTINKAIGYKNNITADHVKNSRVSALCRNTISFSVFSWIWSQLEARGYPFPFSKFSPFILDVI